MSSAAIMKVITTPSKIASSLDWRKVSGSVLSLDIHPDRIGLALASHPSYGEGSSTLEPIKLARKGRVTEECKEILASIVKDHKVCGVVVSWPLQEDTRRMGAACGRVLYTLERILENSNIITPSRPFCLWNDHQCQEKQEEPDVFGRSAVYSKIPSSDKHIHKASEEQYSQDENVVAADVWDDFVRVHWPDVYRQQERQQFAATLQAVPKEESYMPAENWEDTSAYVNAAVL
jgi:RNase H-fold protein (predicted Holliday junction resolvase)